MNTTLVIIRTFPADDYIAYLCYKSFTEVMNADYIFFAEEGEYKWINEADELIFYRRECGNFGGQMGVNVCRDYLSKIDVSGYDKVIFSDSDIKMIKDPLEVEADFGGIQDKNNPRHFSGQLLIYSSWLWQAVLQSEAYDLVMDLFLKTKKDIADDTVMSHIATGLTEVVYNYPVGEYWIHEKLNHLEPKI